MEQEQLLRIIQYLILSATCFTGHCVSELHMLLSKYLSVSASASDYLFTRSVPSSRLKMLRFLLTSSDIVTELAGTTLRCDVSSEHGKPWHRLHVRYTSARPAATRKKPQLVLSTHTRSLIKL